MPNPSERALGLTDPDYFLFRKKYLCAVVSNRNFLYVINFDFTSSLTKIMHKLVATDKIKLKNKVILVTGALA